MDDSVPLAVAFGRGSMLVAHQHACHSGEPDTRDFFFFVGYETTTTWFIYTLAA